ncbi:MAG: hypothetical protein IPM92_02965 [Saprospiraceae bacterium]|nr:hypothetical protein [Saprospiraceae bacterium]
MNLNIIHDKLVPFEYNFSPRLLWKGGLQIEYFINDVNSIETGLYLSARGSKVDPRLFRVTSNVTYYLYENALLYRRYFYDKKFGIGLGICNTWPQSYGIHLYGDKTYYLDFILGCKYRLNNRFQIESSFIFGDLVTFFNKDELFYFSVYNLSISITLGKCFKRS